MANKISRINMVQKSRDSYLQVRVGLFERRCPIFNQKMTGSAAINKKGRRRNTASLSHNHMYDTSAQGALLCIQIPLWIPHLQSSNSWPERGRIAQMLRSQLQA